MSVFIHKELHILTTPYGRSIVYCLTALIILTQFTWFEITNAIIVFLLGGYVFYNMHNAEVALAAMKAYIADDKQLKLLFDSCDLDKNGFLDSKELATACTSLGSKLNHDELEAAILILDKTGSGRVSFDQFKVWYSPMIHN